MSDPLDQIPDAEWEALRKIGEAERSKRKPLRPSVDVEPMNGVHLEPASDDVPTAEPDTSRRPDPFETFDPITLHDKPVPLRRWMIEPLVPAGAATTLSGDGGLGKSVISQMALTAAALGRNLFGRATTPCKTFGVFCEDHIDELHRRQEKINAHYGVAFGDLENMRWACRVGRDTELVVFGENGRAIKTITFEQLHHAVTDFGARLVTLDSLHDVFGGEEISRRQARAFMAVITKMAIAIDGGVIVLQHPSLSGLNSGSGTSGSTAWRNAARQALYLTADPDNGDKRILKTTKANYVAAGGVINLTWREGVFVADDEEPALFKSLRAHGAEDAFLDAFRRLTGRGMRLNHIATAVGFAPQAMLKAGLTPGRSRKDLETAMFALITAGKLTVKYARPATQERAFLEEVQGAPHAGSH